MLNHLNLAKHNEDFLNTIENAAPNSFFDWKITVCFYSALHYLRALEKLKKKQIGNSHKQFLFHLDSSNKDAVLPINRTIFEHYQSLFDMAHKTRYTAFINAKFQMSLYKSNLEFAKNSLSTIKQYCVKQGIK